MVTNLINALRDIIGTPEFYVRLAGQQNYTWDYGTMLEYMFAGILLCIVVGSVFKFIRVLLR